MKSQDWSDPDNNRNRSISELAEICSAMGLSWSASEKEFVITLPTVFQTPVGQGSITIKTPKKSFDISNWGPKGVDETEPVDNIKMNDDGTIGPIDPSKPSNYNNPIPDDFQMPNYGQILDEGEPPSPPKEQEED